MPWGITLGWAVQALTLLSALVVPLMLVVGIFFLTMWVTCLIQGARIDAEVAQREAVAREAETAAGAAPGPAPAGGSADGPADRVGE